MAKGHGVTLRGHLECGWHWASLPRAEALAGAVVHLKTWPNTQLSFVALIAGGALFPADAQAPLRRTRFDLPGLILLALSLSAFSAVFTLSGMMSGLASLGLAVASALGFAGFALAEARASAPLVRLDLLRDRVLGTGLASLMLVSAIVMATLVVGPFYLGYVLHIGPVETGAVMSVGPVVAALTGVSAGGLVDRLGSFPVVVAGLLAVSLGSLLLTVMPGLLGVSGYTASLVVITFVYAMFQASNMAAVMQRAPKDQKGTTSALLGRSRNMGLVWGASAMAALYATGPRIAETFGISAASGAGLGVTFSAAACLAGLSLAAVLWGQRN